VGLIQQLACFWCHCEELMIFWHDCFANLLQMMIVSWQNFNMSLLVFAYCMVGYVSLKSYSSLSYLFVVRFCAQEYWVFIFTFYRMSFCIIETKSLRLVNLCFVVVLVFTMYISWLCFNSVRFLNCKFSMSLQCCVSKWFRFCSSWHVINVVVF